MVAIVLYGIKLSICLILVYGFYWLFLRRLTFFSYNRLYLLGCTFFSFLLPLLDISSYLHNDTVKANLAIPPISSVNEYMVQLSPFIKQEISGQYFSWIILIEILMATGMLFFFIRLVVEYISYRKMLRKAVFISGTHVRIYHLDADIIPFSFGNAVFLNRNVYTEKQFIDIIRHEKVHSTQNHSIDIVYAEILCAINWYNPFAWLLKKAIRQNLEFIADHRVLNTSSDKRDYQYLLLQVTGKVQFGLVNKFNFSSIKNRIEMMNRKKSKKWYLFKYLFLIPLAAVLLMAFRNSVVLNKPVKNSAINRVSSPKVLNPNPRTIRTKTNGDIAEKKTNVKTKDNINVTENSSDKNLPPKDFISISALSSKEEIHDFIALLRENKYKVDINKEEYKDSKLSELSGVLSGEPFKNSLTGPLNFSITYDNSSLLGFNPNNGRLYWYRITTATTNH